MISLDNHISPFWKKLLQILQLLMYSILKIKSYIAFIKIYIYLRLVYQLKNKLLDALFYEPKCLHL